VPHNRFLKLRLIIETLSQDPLVEPCLRPHMLVLEPKVVLRLLFLLLKRGLFLLDDTQVVQFDHAILLQTLHLDQGFVDGLLGLGGPDDVLEVFE